MDAWTGSGIRFAHAGGGWFSALLVVGFLVIFALGAREAFRQSIPRRRWALVALRLITSVGALLFCLQPEWVRTRVKQVQGRVAVLVDASRSMSVHDGDQSRAGRALSLLRGFSREDKQAFDLYAFGASAHPTKLGDLSEQTLVEEDDTRIAPAIVSVARELADDLGAMVVISDGAEHSKDASFEKLAKLGVRVHTIAPEAGAFEDDAIVALKADAIAFRRQVAEVQVTVRSTRRGASTLSLHLHEGERVIGEQVVGLDERGEGTATLTFTPLQVGRAAYRVSLPLAEDDAVVQNNERAFLVRVTRDKLRVLLLCGGPTWDARFLRAFLRSDPAIDLITFFILRTNNDLSMAAPEELSLIPFPTDELFREHLESFDLVIFQDFNYGPYQVGGYLPNIRDYVVRGGAFAMIGGSRAFGAGGYQNTPLAEILPVSMVSGSAALTEQAFSPVIVDSIARHPVLGLLPNAAHNTKAWAELAPLVGANKLAGLRSGGQALLVHPAERDAAGSPMPVLAVGSAGQGRVLALASDSSWRWGITTAGLRGDASAYDRFWDGALRWLARDPLLEPALVETDKESYGPGAQLKARLRLRDERYAPLSDRAFELFVLDAEGKASAATGVRSDAEGVATAELRVPMEPGAYRLAVREPEAAALLAEQAFIIEAGGLELADPQARPQLMREIAAATSGTFHSLRNPPKLVDLNRSRAQELGSVVSAPFLSPWFFAFLVLAFAAEWMMRRAYGLR